MNKSDLIDAMAADAGISKAAAKAAKQSGATFLSKDINEIIEVLIKKKHDLASFFFN